MAVYALGEVEPRIHPDAFVHPDATVIGNVTVGAEATIWPQAVLRGDEGAIAVGAQTSIQDGSVIHCTAHLDTVIGSRVVIGHLVHLEGCTIEDRALVGNGSIVLHRAVVSTGALVGAGAVVLDGTVVPTGAMALGIPAKLRPDSVDADEIDRLVESYLRKCRRYKAELRRLD
jgi:carbonic anhydrase/acetyltransferase-like protein (isoleucine patch superfamily)